MPANAQPFNVEQTGTQTEGKPSSFLNPTGTKGSNAPPKAIGPMMELVVFFAFVIVRAFHPVVIDASKALNEETGKKEFLYQTSSAVIVMTVGMCIMNLITCYVVGGQKQFA